MHKQLLRVFNHTQPQLSGHSGHLGVVDAGAVQVCGAADLMLGVLDAAHLMVALCAAHAGGDDDRAAQTGSQGLDLFQQLGLHAVGIAVTIARAVTGGPCLFSQTSLLKPVFKSV